MQSFYSRLEVPAKSVAHLKALSKLRGVKKAMHDDLTVDQITDREVGGHALGIFVATLLDLAPSGLNSGQSILASVCSLNAKQGAETRKLDASFARMNHANVTLAFGRDSGLDCVRARALARKQDYPLVKLKIANLTGV